MSSKGIKNPTLFRKKSARSTEDEALLSSAQCQGKALTPLNPGSASFTALDPWRVLRIQSEYVQAFDAMAEVSNAVCVFGSARTEESDPDYLTAVEISKKLAQMGFAIITGGGPGIMEAANKGAMEANGVSIGCNIELPHEQFINDYVNLPVNFRYFFCRKTTFVKYAQAFILLPGGFGTIDELFDVVTLIQTKKVKNFPVVLVNSSFWNGLIFWIKDQLLKTGKIASADLEIFKIVDTADQAVEIIQEQLKKSE